MKAVIFSGAVGTRMWPLSRSKYPKQFIPLVDGKSTLQLMYQDYINGYCPPEKIYLSTNQQFKSFIKKLLPNLLPQNLILEPAIRDLGPSVGYAASILNLEHPQEPMAILWSDDLIKKPKIFYQVLQIAETYLQKNPHKIVYIGQDPLFVDQNKGWIHKHKLLHQYPNVSMYSYKDWHYRPPLETAQKYFQSGEYTINTGYFMSTPQYITNLYQKYAPQMYHQLQQLVQSWGTSKHQSILNKIYPQLEKVSFDDLVLSKTKPEDAVILTADMGWYGFGDWDAIKVALQNQPAGNVIHGKVIDRNSQDTLVYNLTQKLITTIDLQGMLVVATKDVIMVCPKESVPEIKKLLHDFKGTEYEKYT